MRTVISNVLLAVGLFAIGLALGMPKGAPHETPVPVAKTAKLDRPKPLTSTLLIVCEHNHAAIAVAIFTYADGRTVIVDKDNPLGFTQVQDLLDYAAQAGPEARQYVQECEGLPT